MNIPVLCRAALLLAVPAAFSSAAETSLNEPTPENAAAVALRFATPAAAIAPDWHAQAAPGRIAPPAADARQQWLVLRGWTRVALTGAGAPAGAPSAQELPDDWPRFRSYQRAWYVLRADFGPALPASLWMQFDAVAHQCDVFVNGQAVAHHLGGYTPFGCEITRAAHPGVNVIAVFVRDEHAVITATGAALSQLGVDRPGTFASVAGIRGGISFEARSPVHVAHVLIHPSTRQNRLDISTWLQAPAPVDVEVRQAVYVWPDGTTPVLELPPVRGTAGGAPLAAGAAWADARRWSPEHPNLYVLRTTVRAGGATETIETRFGFREFWIDGKNFVLNGTPIRLLGPSVAHDFNAVETPDVGRRISHDTFVYLKREFNYRAIRLHAFIHPPGAADAADEVGVLVSNQSAIWSAMGGAYERGGPEFMGNMEREFAEWFWRDANKPSVVIWEVENEMIRDQRGPEREKWVLALDRFIQQLDPTRIVEHCGAAWYAPDQETIHVHMQEQYAAILRAWTEGGHVPIVLGEFWMGGRGGETRLPDAREYASRLDWLQDESRIYREKMLEMRNAGASGVMPFRLDQSSLVRVNSGLRRSYDPAHDRIFAGLYPGLKNVGATALAPALAFAWPRTTTFVAGEPVEKEIVVSNDREEPATLRVACDYAGDHREWTVTLAPTAQDRRKVAFAAASSGDLTVTLTDAGGAALPGDVLALHALAAATQAAPQLARHLVVVPAPDAQAAQALHALGLAYETAATVPRDAAHTLLLVPPRAPRDALGRNGAAVRRFLADGGRLLALEQTDAPEWLPLRLPWSPALKKSAPEFTLLGWPEFTRNLIFSRAIPVLAAGHPAFAGLAPADLTEWNAFDGRVADDAFVRPGAVETQAGAAYRVLAGATRRETASIVETDCDGGTAVFCQAQVLTQSAHPAARAILFNLLRYLDGAAWPTAAAPVGLAGDLQPAQLAKLTGLPAGMFVPGTVENAATGIVLAGAHADVAQLDALARAGSTVIVLSAETAGRLPGYKVSRSNRALAGTRAGTVDERLFWGVSTASFLPLDESPARGLLAQRPPTAQVALGGLSGFAAERRNVRPRDDASEAVERMEDEDPLATVEARGAGRLVVTTLEPWNATTESHRQLLATLLANAGLRLPVAGDQPPIALVKTTPPVRIDGRLDDWTNDMEDRNVSPFRHAMPIVLSSRDAVGPRIASDLDLSGLVYLLREPANLDFAGVVFGGATRIELAVAGHQLALDLVRNAISVDGQAVADAKIAAGRGTAHDLGDTRLLSLTRFNAQIGSMSGATDAVGRTFEMSVPLAALGLAGQPADLPAHFRLIGAAGTIEAPAPVENGAAETLLLHFEPR